MVIQRIDSAEVVAQCRMALGLDEDSDEQIDEALLAALVRRAAGLVCPCSAAALRASVVESLQLLPAGDDLRERIDAVIESLLVGGDLLELHDVATDDGAATGTWVFAAPPGFVRRPSGTVFVVGIVPDHDVFLPEEIAGQVVYEGTTRVIPSQDEDLAASLREHGLQELSEDLWLKTPKAQTPEEVVDAVRLRLGKQPRSGGVEGLQLLDPEASVTYYRGRWTVPRRHTGMFVARRPQDYGAPIWCVAELEDGIAVRFVDLPPRASRWRGCDAAWHLQMAIDRSRNDPQRYRRRDLDGGVRLDFFSPLPLWAQRRLMLFGKVLPRERSLLSYWLPGAESEAEERFLQERLWLVRSEDPG
jgi:hypothetical protein